MSEEKKHFRTCTLCEAMCGITITTIGSEIKSIAGDKDDPFSRGHICPKAVALKDLHEDPERIKKPMERTADGWKEVSWNYAFDRVVKNIKEVQGKHGNAAFGAYLGNPNVHNLGALLFNRAFLGALKSSSVYSATSVDQLPHHIVGTKLFGHQLKVPVPDIDRTDHFIIIGANPLASNGSIMSVPDVKNRLQAIRKRGGKVVVIDPRKSETANLADEHFFIKPKSDVLLLLAIANLMFKNNWVTPGKLKDITPDLDKIADYVKDYTPEKVAEHTGISAANIEAITKDFADAKTGVIYGRMGVSTQSFGALCQYLLTVLNILKGSLDAPGGMLFTKPAVNILGQVSKGRLVPNKTRVRGLPSFGGELPVSSLAEEITTPGKGQIKAMVLWAGNPVLSTPNGEQLDKAFAQLDYLVSVDFYINESNRHANIILPPVGPLEREHYDVIFHNLAVRNTSKYSKALFEKPKGTKHDWEIAISLAERLQKPTFMQKRLNNITKKRGLKFMLGILLRMGPYGGKMNPFKGLTIKQLRKQPHGIDLGPLASCLPEGLFHKDKKIHLELDFYFGDLDRVNKTFFDTTDTITASENELQLYLIGRRYVRSNNSWLHNSARLVKGKNKCTAMIHPDDSKLLGITDNQTVKVKSRVGEIELPAEISDEIMPGVISIPHGYGHNKKGTQWSVAEQHAGVSVNDLTDEMDLDELSGNAVLNGVKVVVKAA